MTKESKLIILSAGGTGGHVFPAAALATELKKRGCRVELVTDARGVKFAKHFGNVPVHVVQAGTMGAGIGGKVKGLAKLAFGTAQSFFLIGKTKPAVVVGFGGYPSAPAMFAAQLRGVPTVLHEQNAVLGKANELLARKASRIALSFAPAAAPDSRTIVTGNPVRTDIAMLRDRPYPSIGQGEKLVLFVVGGSLGASVFSEVVPAALVRLPPGLKTRLSVTQQCRAEDMDSVRAAYEQAGIDARLESFFDDVPGILGNMHLAICRSGASTVAEVTAAGRPAIFVPYPHHGDVQQKRNAESVVAAGGAWLFDQKDFTPDTLYGLLEKLLNDPAALQNAAASSRSCGHPDATAKLADAVMAL